MPVQSPIPSNRYLLWILAFVLSVPAAVLTYRFGWSLLTDPGRPIPGDFMVYWRAVERTLAQEPVYRPTDGSPFKYSPTFLYLFKALVHSDDVRRSVSLWSAFSVLSFFSGMGWLIWRCLALFPNRQKLIVGTLALGIVLGWRGFFETLAYGQVDLILQGMFLVWTATLLRPWSKPETFLFWSLPGLVLMIKPQMGIAFLPCFAFLPLPTLALLGSITLVWYLAPGAWIGLSSLALLFEQWVACLRIQQSAEFISGNLNQSLSATLARIIESPGSAGTWTTGLLIVFVVLVTALRFRIPASTYLSEPRLRVQLALAGLSAFLVFSPLSWRWMIMAWAPILALSVALTRGRRVLILGVALSLLTHSVFGGWIEKLHSDGVSHYGIYTWVSLCWFVGMAWNLFQKKRHPCR